MIKETEKINEHGLTIGWLYPDLMSIYGDRGNIITLQKRCEARGIKTIIKNISLQTPPSNLETCDMLFMGGAQDSQQNIVSADLKGEKKVTLSKMIEDGIPGLYICGAYQLLGKHYEEADGLIIKGLGILDLYTKNPGKDYRRLVGNVAVELNQKLFSGTGNFPLIGFENHGGRTYLGKNLEPLGTIRKGFGNNGEDSGEGAVYKNSIGSYLHGPILPKNPELADWLIDKALEKKYSRHIELEKLDDALSFKARAGILKRILD